MVIPEPLPHDKAIKAALETIGKQVGFADAPAGVLDTRGLPIADYLILYPVSSALDGSLGDPQADGEFVYQVTVVGRLPDGVRWLAGRIPAALVAVTVAGRSVMRVETEDYGPVTVDRDVGPPHPFYATPRFRLFTTP